MRTLLRGLLSGFLLSCARVPLGVDLLQTPAVGGRTAYAWRSIALIGLAIGLFLARQTSLGVRFVTACLLGFGLHSLLIANAWSPDSSFALGATVLLGLAAIAGAREGPETSEEAAPARYLELLGLAASGAGAALALEGVARHVRLLGGALSQDDSVFACVLLGLLLAGALAFGWMASSRGLRGLSLPAGLAAGTAACLVSLKVLSQLAIEENYTPYLRGFGLDSSLRGTLSYDALIAAACFVAPGLLLGAAISGAPGRKRIFSVLVGAALGLSLLPSLLEVAPGSTTAEVQPSSTELIPLGILMASGGALVAILSLSERGPIARWAGIAVALGVAAPVLLIELKPVHILSPWAKRRTYPLIVSDTPEGLMTIETYGISGGSWPSVTLDRRAITPPFEEIAVDELRLRGSFELLPSTSRSKGVVRLLFVGQLTPERVRVLGDLGVHAIDRTAAWHLAMKRFEDVLWDQLPVPEKPPEGAILSLDEARDRIAGGEYDLVLVPSTPGDPPRTRQVDVPASTTVVRWIGIDEPMVSRDLGEQVAFTADGFEFPAVALLTHAASTEGSGASAPLLIAPGTPRAAPTPLSWLQVRKSERGDLRAERARAEVMARFAAAAASGPDAELLAGLANFQAAQERSSPFETLEERTELPETCLARFRAAALAREPGPYVRRLWDMLARILSRKRWVEETYTYLQPVADRYPAWPALQIALARADLESLAPEEAAARLDALAEVAAPSFELFELLGSTRCALGEPAKALEAWKRAAPLPTTDRAARRKVVLAVARAGDPVGIEAATKLLMELPSDSDLREVLGRPANQGPIYDPCSN